MKLIFRFWVLFVFSSLVHAADSKIGIIVFDGFLTSDVTAAVEVFNTASQKEWFSHYDVVLISATKIKRVTSAENLGIVADKTIYDDLHLDVLIVPSAYDMSPLVSNKDLVSYIKNHGKEVSWLASNCSGAFLLGEAGLLNGKKATTWAGGEKELSSAYPMIKVQFDQNVVVDGNIITSNGGPISYQAAFELLTHLSTKEHSNEIVEALQFARLKHAF
ncbi:transcriptional regulator [Oleiphilus messinensis]|uniref:Transcriptional regulator n=1 Tax=Oleiphilus messinensis TaxID=141451 RepID=A0A1Y0IED6_9GAMM|nr:DJ-1/PfpI family protein [Oleiphilus messinensis]ARU58898.1 transcriptional regulator [Oleiphilus messinensis]